MLGATGMSDISLLAHQSLVFADPPSEATVRRALAGLDTAMLARIAKARAKVRARVWDLLARRPDGFPWLAVAGKVLTGWVVIDLDATLITAHSDKQGAAATFTRAFGRLRIVRNLEFTYHQLADRHDGDMLQVTPDSMGGSVNRNLVV